MLDTVDKDSEMELRHYLHLLWRGRWMILVTLAFTLGPALALSFRQTPVYVAQSDLLLQPRITDSLFDDTGVQSGSQDAQGFLATEIQVLQSQEVRDGVAKKLNVSFAPDVVVERVGDSRVLRVVAESRSATFAAAVANAYVEADVELRRQQITDDVRTARGPIDAKIADLQVQIDDLNRRTPATTTPQRVPVDDSLVSTRDALVAQQAALKKTVDGLEFQGKLSTGGARVLKPAEVPPSPDRPSHARAGLLAASLGLVLGVGMVFLVDQLDDSVQSTSDLEQAVGPGLPILGMIPTIVRRENQSAGVASLTQPRSRPAEAYRTLRTAVQYHGIDRPLRCVQVTSASASEGKTTTAANLAVVLAQSGTQVVLVDCDLRRPNIASIFGLSNKIGLTSVILGDVPLSSALQPVPGVDNLRVLATGALPPNPADVLSLQRTEEVLESLHGSGRIVLLDCPPVLLFTDANVLASYSDATLLVAAAGISQRKQIHRAVELLRLVEAPLTGTVFNRVAPEQAYGYGYGYGYGRYTFSDDDGLAGRRSNGGESAGAPLASGENR